MEVRKGYKWTEVGVVPEDWEVKELKNLSENIMVGIASSATHAYRRDGIIMFRNQNIKPNYLDDSDILFIDPTYETVFKNKRLKAGDLLTARTGYPGTTCIVPKKYEGSQSFTTLITRLKNEEVITEFLCFYINSEKGQIFFEQNQIGGGQKNVNAGTLKLMHIPLPPTKAEQSAIATALSEMEGLISGLEKLIGKKRDIKVGAMQELLRTKEGWKILTLGAIADENIRWSFTGGPFGSNLKSADYTDSGVRVIQLQNIGDGVFHDESVVFTSEEKANELISCNIYPGEIILSKMGDPVARACMIPNTHPRYLMCSDGIRLAVNQKEHNVYFIFTYINSLDFRIQAENGSTGSTRKRIGLSKLKKLELVVPKLEEQNRIAGIIESMQLEINALDQKLTKYKQLKQGMMQELLTGKTRLV